MPISASAADLALPAEPSSSNLAGDASILIQQHEEPAPLEFDVPLPRQRSLRERDPQFDHLLKNLPDLETQDVPFKKGWTEAIADAFNRQLLNGPDECEPNKCVGAEQVKQRMRQLDTDYGPQDDWTWTPPSR